MKAIITATILLTLTKMAFCQNKNLEFGLSVSPSFYRLTSQNGFDHKYHSNTNFITGLDISFSLTKKSNLLTGLYYSSVKYNTEYKFLVEQPGDPLIPGYGHISASYLEIPLIYVFKLASGNKFFIYSSPGIITSILFSSNDKTTFEDNSTRSSKYLNSFLTSLQLGVGMKYKLSDKWQIKIEPQYRSTLKGIDKIMNQQPNSLNIPLGVVYTLLHK